jgi:hypothetical protein
MRLTAVQRWPEFLYEPLGRQRRRFLDIGVLEHDDGIVAAELQHLALVDGLGGDVLADRHAAGEGHEIDIGTRQQFIGDLGRVARQHRQHRRRQPASYRMSASAYAVSGVFSLGLSTIAVVGGDRGRHLVDDLVQRMVERRDRADDALQRLAQGVDLAASCRAR